ncbi:hypothetical protein AB0F91_09740 [Amycolatopsis sp. NPDC023774]|uniref:ATP-dependent DNA ligase n=1 Tax=Amycolatopsis sp. NPDC023774 TaxID=3155015 RepID=UPI0033F25DA8
MISGNRPARSFCRRDWSALVAANSTARQPPYFVAFDLRADAADDLRSLPYQRRRDRLEQLFAVAVPPLQLAPSTTDRTTEVAWMPPEVSAEGIEGVVGKLVDAPYRPGGPSVGEDPPSGLLVGTSNPPQRRYRMRVASSAITTSGRERG